MSLPHEFTENELRYCREHGDEFDKDIEEYRKLSGCLFFDFPGEPPLIEEWHKLLKKNIAALKAGEGSKADIEFREYFTEIFNGIGGEKS